MGKKRVKSVILVLLLLCGASAPGAETSANITTVALDAQLEINRKALYEGSVDAAVIMLYNEQPQARNILFEALRQSENTAAKTAVCKGLIQTRGLRKPIPQSSDFIKPLLQILISDTPDISKLAAEATLIFKYKQISEQLEAKVNDPALDPEARVKAIEALKRPDLNAIFKLMDMLDDNQAEVVDAAEKALNSLGIPVVGKDRKTREQIRKEIRHKGPDKFLRDWLIRQDTEMRQLQKDLDSWKKRYSAAADKIYDMLGEEDRSRFLAERLNDDRETIRLWALEKVYQSWVGTGLKSKSLAELEPALINLITDLSRDVRLRAAKLLVLMGGANATEKLTEQYRLEEDDEVKIELFAALGAACHYALSDNSITEAQAKARMQTLELASEYLTQKDAGKSKRGAEVIKKLLEHKGLKDGEVEKYLDLLAKRYSLARAGADEPLAVELLGTMAGLCAQSTYKQLSARAFGALFEKALAERSPALRETAADGLIYIDKTRALSVLRKNFVDDDGIIMKLIELADEVGGEQDLQWLAEKTGKSVQGERAWQAMLKIFKQCDAKLLGQWLAKLNSEHNNAGLSSQQQLLFLAVAERKAVGEKKAGMLNNVRTKSARLYTANKDFDRAAEYWGLLLPTAKTAEQKETILANLLDVYLRKPNLRAAGNLVENSLLEKDLDSNSLITRSIETFLAAPPNGVDLNAALDTFSRIKPAKARPNWQRHLNRWLKQFKKTGN